MNKRMSNYLKMKERAKFRSTQPSMTDQSQTKSTDVNVIVKQFQVTGAFPGSPTPPMYGDFSQLPQDLAEALEQSRSLNKLRARLPKELQAMTLQELIALTPADIERILTPPVKPTDVKPTDIKSEEKK